MDRDEVEEDALFFGSRRTFLTPTDGRVSCYGDESIRDDAGSSARVAELGRVEAKDGVVIVPAIPALALVATESAESALPAQLLVPLVKTRSRQENSLEAVASGVRSALVKVGSKWYRLKGCGNHEDGFTWRSNKAAGWRDVRGCAFEETALRECFMTAQLPGGVNHGPVAIARYSKVETVQPCCIIETTDGDRRFGSHVLAGLEVLMPILVGEGVFSGAANLFPKLRPGASEKEPVSTAELMTDLMLGHPMWPHMKGSLDASVLVDATEFSRLGEVVPNSNLVPSQWTNEGAQPMSDQWRSIWLRTVSQYEAALGNARLSPLMYLFSRCGHDAGSILRTMHSRCISWGTYQDQMCRRDLDEWHCNAHANNFVVLRNSAKSFLSFLDLDMAFHKDFFVDFESGKVGLDDAEWAALKEREYNNLMEVLAGADVSSGVPRVAKTETENQSAGVKLTKSVLYDALILGFRNGYAGSDCGGRFPVAEHDEKTHAAASLLVRLALVVMADFVA